jgi:hypothetical protein
MPDSVPRFSRRKTPVAATNDFLEEKAGQARDIDPLAGQVSGK